MYLLDTNVFIDAKNRYYDFDVCPAFWDWLVGANERGVVGSVEAVYDELVASDDRLAAWARDHSGFFAPVTSPIVASIGSVIAWATASPDYDAAAKTEFAATADSSLIGQATEGRHIVVSHEVASNSRKRIRIPNAAVAHGVKVVSPFIMLRTERARFVLESLEPSGQLAFSH